ncbi:A24 family peptidase [Caulobacter sp. CCNWLY153]|uniref:prepilin peptidase n=1 Tax=unclassified Caulobacter TaxID=2648921 RepID=UPI002FEFA3D2
MIVAAGWCLAGGVAGLVAHVTAQRLAVVPLAVPAWVAAFLGGVLAPWGVAQGSGVAMAVVSIALLGVLLALALVDLTVLRLPDLLTLPLAGSGVAWAVVVGEPVVPRLIGAVAGYSAIALLARAYRRWRGREGVGLGDAKLLAAGGAWLGWQALPLVVLLGCALALSWSGARVVGRGVASLAAPLAFGPALAAGIWIVWCLRAAGRI